MHDEIETVITVLCNADDLPAVWAFRELSSMLGAGVRLVTVESLVYSTSIVAHWDTRGALQPQTGIGLPSGDRLTPLTPGGLLNRVARLPDAHLQAAVSTDLDYARNEWFAFMLAWLEAFPGPVVNPVGSQGLSGPSHHLVEWHHLAATAGLPGAALEARADDPLVPAPNPMARRRSVIMLDGKLFGSAASAVDPAACARFASLAGLRLAQLDFEPDADGVLAFRGASPLADLREGGRALVVHLADVLTAGEGAS